MRKTMHSFLRNFFSRKQAKESYGHVIKAGIGGAIAIAVLILLGKLSDNAMLMAPFGATCVLLFSQPKSPLSQPINVIAGHVVSVSIGLILNNFLPTDWWGQIGFFALAVGLAITIMAALRVTHPPAGADPIVVFLTSPGWEYIFFPVAFGSIVLVITAWLFHKIPPTAKYPLPEDN